jgi:rod shape-determining protein MreD
MRLNYFFPILLFFPLLFLQIILVPLISIDGFVPDLILILLVYYTLKEGQLYGTILGFIFGLLFDLITGGILGSTMFTKTLVGFIAGYFYNANKKDLYFKEYSFLLIILLCSVIDSVAFSIISSFEITSNLISIIFNRGLIPAIYTTVISVLITIFYPKRSYF